MVNLAVFSAAVAGLPKTANKSRHKITINIFFIIISDIIFAENHNNIFHEYAIVIYI